MKARLAGGFSYRQALGRIQDGLGGLPGQLRNLLRQPALFAGDFSRLEEPIRADIFSPERLEQHGESLAAAQVVAAAPAPGYELAARIRDNGRVLRQGYSALGEAVRQQRAITSAAEWLLDNFHIVEEQLRNIQEYLTARFYRTLPKLAAGPLRGYPRVYGIAWAFVAHTDSHFDAGLFTRFLHAYQRIQPLATGELWALPIMLRCVMIENLRRLCVTIVSSQNGRRQADQLADHWLAPDGASPDAVAIALQRLPEAALQPAFVVQLVQRLRYQDPGLALPLQELNARLALQGRTCDEMVRAEHARQAAASLTVRNLITSMRTLSAIDWQVFFEGISLVDACLRGDPGFAAMDFTTQDRYRRAIENLAKGARWSELDIARAVIAKTAQARSRQQTDPADERRLEPGYYLIASGRREFEREIGFQPSLRQRLLRLFSAHAGPAYLGTIQLLIVILLAPPLLASAQAGVTLTGLLLLGLLGFFPASDIAVTLMNWLVTGIIGPRHLPRLKLADGVPSSLRTFVVMPTLLTREVAIAEQIRQLEIHYLANPHGDVRFALLSDWTDAATVSRPDDAGLLEVAAAGVAVLNARYGKAPDGGPRFFLFHRHRRWNETERKWMGWERKRGKLHEFNRLLGGATDTSFIAIDGQPPRPPAAVRYVITLDADTRLPLDTVRQLVGVAAHPLNRPRLDPDHRRVVEGYGILQPRITPTLPSTQESTLFQRIYSGPGGMDPYAGAVSDVYQDLFGEGSYTGKGLYDVAAFETALAGRAPENALLSHDLFESLFARCGLVSDIEFFEDFPSHSEVAAGRAHRWARGDWQLLPWIFGPAGRDIPPIGRWKMLDNLRRSLAAPGALGALLASWSLPLAPTRPWLELVLAALALPVLLAFAGGLLPRRRGNSIRHYLRVVAGDLLWGGVQVAVALTLLAHHAWLMLDASARTLYRLLLSRRHLLEWTTAAQAKSLANFSLGNFLWPLRSASIIAFSATALVLACNQDGLTVAAPFIVLWWTSPLVAQLISLPPRKGAVEPLQPEEIIRLRLAGRKTWRFFTTFVGPKDHWLPPDNFQEDPRPVIAHRSSPTNFGLYLLTAIAARDFGWSGITDMVDRLEATLNSLQRLPRYRGHFYNWYDTRDRRPLEPRYISSVDSGNLAGHLLALANGCDEMARRPVFTAADLQGIQDTAGLLRAALEQVPDDRRTITVSLSQLQAALDELEALLAGPPSTVAGWAARWQTLAARAAILVDIAQTFADEREDAAQSEVLAWAKAFQTDIASHVRDLPLLPPLGQSNPGESSDRIPALQDSAAPQAVLEKLRGLAATARQLFKTMEFGFLFDANRKLFSIGYRVADDALDESYYDLLASEARLTSFIAIAKGDVPAPHWFRLGRRLTPVGDGAALLSWSGSMFEYLMPSLVMYTPRYSLLYQTCRLAIGRQIEYGGERRAPWGVSEAAYNVRDRALTYQYSAFGVPGLGLKRGLGEDLVVAPYATALAAMYDGRAAVRNFERIEAAGGRGLFGFFESMDYTPERLAENQWVAVVRAYMAHHQGMTLVALANAVYDGVMRHRFHREPIIQAAELLLQERPPREAPVSRPRPEPGHPAARRTVVAPVSRRFHSARRPIPATHLLSNGRYAVMVTTAGSGYSVCDGLAITRWREDVTRDHWGSYLFLRNTASGKVWSAGYQPTGARPNRYEVVFLEDRARISRQDGPLSTRLEIVVSPEDNAEMRRLVISNSGLWPCELEITSYAELVLAPLAADSAHPAFSNLFVQTEYLPEVHGLLAVRRPRQATDAPVWAAHVIAADGEVSGVIEYETDRARFLGRGGAIRRPDAVLDGRPLSNTVGAVLDPIFSLRARVRVASGAAVRLAFSTLVAATREQLIELINKYRDPATFERISTLAWTQAQVQLHHLGIEPEEAHLFQYLANRVLYLDPSLRPSADLLKRNTLSARTLWHHGISGDYPIVLLHIDAPEHDAIVRQLLRAHEYWRARRLAVDLVILNERAASYAQEWQTSLESRARASQAMTGSGPGEQRGGIFVLRADLLAEAEYELLQCAARAILAGRQGSLAEQVMRPRRTKSEKAPPPPRQPAAAPAAPALQIPPLEFFNGLGGFADDGREYVTVLGQGQRTPAPWLNVIANPQFGFQVSESGSGYTWALNSRENQLTPWSNDPVGDPPGEAFYLRDDETGELWSPTALPIRLENATYIARHGQGYSRFQHSSHGIASDLLQFVRWDEPVKISRLTLENHSPRVRRLTLTAYVEWVLGAARAANAPFIITEIDPATGAMFACNPWNAEFSRCIAFIDWAGRQTAWTGDRTEFIGRNGSLEQPAGLARGNPLSNRTGAGFDPGGVLQTTLELGHGERVCLTFFLGQADDRETAQRLIGQHRALDLDAALATVSANWEHILTRIQVETPERALDLMLNRWLLYQTLVCRLWARTAFYQAGGAYGFRDQLQDGMALVMSCPELVRAQLLRAAARQFIEGDVQHWWHPPSGRGVRTHCSDDRVWLPYAVANYIQVSGDSAVLDECIPFLEGPPLAPEREDAYFEPVVSSEQATLFEHCARALEVSLATGSHGLPLIGSGDWNDGMNRVGPQGRGESVWLGWFLYATLTQFAPLAVARGEHHYAGRWRQHAAGLKTALEKEAWDGAWYRRAYFDDGTPLGAAAGQECRIDSLAQSWSVISGAAAAGRARQAMQAVEQYLIRPGDDLILLFTPPFANTPLDPGYIKGYLPGVRENGGQYTHAAAWCVIAYAMLGEGDRAGELLGMLNPINHASTRAGVHAYKVEPYVVAADIYAEPPHLRRGGWTWYTGSAGWLYRAGIEWLLGCNPRAGRLLLNPCIPRHWRGFKLHYRQGGSCYEIAVTNPNGVTRGIASLTLDGQPLVPPEQGVPLLDDGRRHQIGVVLG
jgi:cyclic beta-1,2-glucan synthetase